MPESKLQDFQFAPLEGDLEFAEGSTKSISPVQDSVGPGEAFRVAGGAAKAGSNANGGDLQLEAGAKDGSGKKGRVHILASDLVLDAIDNAQQQALLPTQVGVRAIDDAGDTEFGVQTNAGFVQITKDGALNVGEALLPVVEQSVSSVAFSPVSGGPGAPTNGNLGAFKTLDFPAGLNREVRAEMTIPTEFRDATADEVVVKVKYARTSGSNSIVRLQTFGAAGNVSLAAETVDLDVSATPVDTIVTSPVLRTLTPAEVTRLTSLALIIRRATVGGEFTGDFRLLDVIIEFKAQNQSVTLSRHTHQFVTSFGSPANGDMGAYKTVDLPPAPAVSEVTCYFNIPRGFQLGTDCLLRLTYAMSTAESAQTVNLQLSGSINNVTSIPNTAVTLLPGGSANTIEVSPSLLSLVGVTHLDEVAIKIRRLGTDTHGGAFRIVSATLVMGAIVSGAGNLPETYFPCVDEIGSANTPDTDTETDLGDCEAYRVAYGQSNGQQVTWAYLCRMPESVSEVARLKVIHKVSHGVGGNRIVVRVRLASGAVVYTSPSLTNTTRTVTEIFGPSLLAQPNAGEPFLVLVDGYVDNLQEARSAAHVAVEFA